MTNSNQEEYYSEDEFFDLLIQNSPDPDEPITVIGEDGKKYTGIVMRPGLRSDGLYFSADVIKEAFENWNLNHGVKDV